MNNETNLAIYHRPIGKLAAGITHDLDIAPGIGRVLNDFFVALI